jgi:hypothetical protein
LLIETTEICGPAATAGETKLVARRKVSAIAKIDFALRDMAKLLMHNSPEAKSYLGDRCDSTSDGFSPLV